MTLKKAFLSSTTKDLWEHREVAAQAINGLDDYKCIRMEEFGARDAMSDTYCRDKVRECDVFVGLLGPTYGSKVRGSNRSYTEQEYDAAVATNRPRLMFLTPKDFLMGADVVETDKDREDQRKFRERVSSERLYDTFRSPAEVGWRVLRAIRNYETLNALSLGYSPAGRSEWIYPLPPQPYFVHPYLLQENFTGRVSSRKELTQWLLTDTRPVLALAALGGIGKSALTWAWVQRDVLGLPLPGHSEYPPETSADCRVPDEARPYGVLWWSFYEREASFKAFLDRALSYCSGGEVTSEAIAEPAEKVRRLANLLRERRYLLVLDGFERELWAYYGISAAYQADPVTKDLRAEDRDCINPHAADLLRKLVASPLQSRLLLTSRLQPRPLEGLAGCRFLELPDLDPGDAVTFFRAMRIKGEEQEIEDACKVYGYHPMALRLLAGMVLRDPLSPGHIAAAKSCDPIPHLVPREHHILDLAYRAMKPPLQELLSRLAAFRSSVQYEAAKTLSLPGHSGLLSRAFWSRLGYFKDEGALRSAIWELADRQLIFLDRQRGRYDLHPIVRQFAYERLTNKQVVHTRLRDYFAATPPPDIVETEEDLDQTVELYYQTIGARGYDQALDLLRDRLHSPLYLHFGAYRKYHDLLVVLFAEGDEHRPRMQKKANQAWALAALADIYCLQGQPRQAIELLKRYNAIQEKYGTKEHLAIGLAHLAFHQVMLGELLAAEQNLWRGIGLSHGVRVLLHQAMGPQKLSVILGSRGTFAQHARESNALLFLFNVHRRGNSEIVRLTYEALSGLRDNDPRVALEPARAVLALAAGYSEVVRAEWLVGAALVKSAEAGQNVDELADETEGHLRKALEWSRSKNIVELLPDVLLTWARWYRLRGDAGQAGRLATEGLGIAGRCGYRLCQADIHNFLAKLAVEAQDHATAESHTVAAYKSAWCDSPPNSYKAALDEAKRRIDQLQLDLPGYPLVSPGLADH